jgi:hypothetical protein
VQQTQHAHSITSTARPISGSGTAQALPAQCRFCCRSRPKRGLNSAGTRLGWLPLLASPPWARTTRHHRSTTARPAIFLAALRGRKAAMQYVPT